MRVPVATYRLQLRPGFGFREVRALVPYLHEIGITDVYSSPILMAKSGSLSGYDVTNPLRLNPELGGAEEFNALAGELKRHGMGLLLDVVPNHMAASWENPWWSDVLENGACSPYASYFDINWDPGLRTWEDKLLRPVLGSAFGTALENQEFTLVLEENGFFIRYYERRFPLDPKSYRSILAHGLDDPGTRRKLGLVTLQEVLQLIEAIERLPARTSTDPEDIEKRYRDKELIKRRLWSLYNSHSEFRNFLDENLRIFNGVKGDPRSFDLLEELLGEQPYALSFWRVAREKINYRRFFDISDLVAVRAEQAEVFQASHALIFQLVEEEKVTGLRVDHVDGLYDPFQYLGRLKQRAPDCYVVVEKILRGEETLPPEWPVCGTTGYEFLNAVSGVLVHLDGLQHLENIYSRFTGREWNFEDVLYEQKRRVIEQLFAGEAFALSLQLGLLADHDRHARDLSPAELERALIEVTACLPIYRTYVRSYEVSVRDLRYIEGAIKEARRRNPAMGEAVFEFLRRVLLLRFPASLAPEQRPAWLRFVMRWQQFSGPAMAKGLEDTALYVHNRLVSMNDVGGDLDPLPLEEFHHFNQSRRECWPFTLNATSTHDTKRSEDVRARIHVLSEMPEIWARHLSRWRNFNAGSKTVIDEAPAPDPNDEILLYQTLIGAWPLDASEVPSFVERLQAFMLKALREAKIHTSWAAPNQVYENAAQAFIHAILTPSERNRFLNDFVPFQKRIAAYGAFQSLSQVLLRLAAPGVPDTYQGSEAWDFSLVDPDNRRPVDFGQRCKLLSEMQSRPVADLLAKWQDGAVKLYLIQKVLTFRREHRDLFLHGDYIPLFATGPREAHVIAFARRHPADWALAVAPRFLVKLSPAGNPPLGKWVWRDTALYLPEMAPLRWRNVITGETIKASEIKSLPLAGILHQFPVALLVAQE